MSQPRVNPHLIIAIGVTGTAFAAIFVRLSSSAPLIIAFYRLLLTVLIITPVFLWMKGWQQLRTLPLKNILIIVGAGVALAFHFVIWFFSLDYTSIASAVVLVDVSAIFTAVLAYLILKERLSRRRLLGIAIAFGGVIIISLTDWSQTSEFALLGDMLALMSAIFCAIYLVAGRKSRQGVGVIPYVFLLYISCTVTLFIACLFTGTAFFPQDPNEYLIFLGLAVVSTVFGHTLWNWALKYVDTAVVGISLLAEPIGSILLGIAIFLEFPHPIIIAGAALVLVGIYLAFRENKGPVEKE